MPAFLKQRHARLLLLRWTVPLLLLAACAKDDKSTDPPSQTRITAVVAAARQRLDTLTGRIEAAKGDEPDLAAIHKSYCAPGADTDWPADAIVKLLKVDELIAQEATSGGALAPAELDAAKVQVQQLAKAGAARMGTAIKARCKKTPSESEVLAGLDGRLGAGYDPAVSLDYAHGHLKELWNSCQESFADLLPAIRAGVEEQKRQHPEWALRHRDWHHVFVLDLSRRAIARGKGKRIPCAPHIPWVVAHPAPPVEAKPQGPRAPPRGAPSEAAGLK